MRWFPIAIIVVIAAGLALVSSINSGYLLGQIQGSFSQTRSSPRQQPQKQTPTSQREIGDLRARLGRDPIKARQELATQLKDYTTERSDHFVLLYKPGKIKKEQQENKTYAKEVLALMELQLELCVIDFKCSRPTERITAIILDEKDFEANVGRSELTAAYSRGLENVFFKKGIISDNDLSHETFHAVIELEKKKMRRGRSFLHWPIEEGLGHSRENAEEKRLRIRTSLLIHLGRLEAIDYPAEDLLASLFLPTELTDQQESDLRVQVTSLILFLLDQGVPPREFLVLAKDVFEAYEKNKNDIEKAAREAKQIVRQFLKKYNLSSANLDKQWLDWEKREARQ